MIHPYFSLDYANAFLPDYKPYKLEHSGGYILQRPIVGTNYFDLMGCYPICPFPSAQAMKADFKKMADDGMISFTCVSDIFQNYQASELAEIFDLCKEYKEHYYYDIAIGGKYAKNHRYKVNRANRSVETKIINLKDYLDDWVNLYNILVKKHNITGIQNFSKEYFSALSKLENLVTIGAFIEDRLVATHLWIKNNSYLYNHLAASNEEGYDTRASYAIYDSTIKYFSDAIAIDFGGGAGIDSASDGLTLFKQGFSNSSKKNYLFGKILLPEIYANLSNKRESKANFFPAYRG